VTRRALSLIALFIFAFALALPAQQSAPPAEAPPADASQAPAPETNAKQSNSTADAFDERAAAQVLATLRDGLEGHSQRRLLSAFDPDKMDGFLTFQDQIDAYFNRYEGFRVTLRILQTSEEDNRGVILAAFQVEGEPRGGGRVSHREAQLRFELERGPKGWKIVDFNPRGFFS